MHLLPPLAPVAALIPKPVRVLGVYWRPVSRRIMDKRVQASVYEPKMKHWQLVKPKLHKHQRAILQRQKTIEKNISSINRQIETKFKKEDPKRYERVGYQWFTQSFDMKIAKFLGKRSLDRINYGPSNRRSRPLSTFLEYALNIMRKEPEQFPDIPKLDQSRTAIALEKRQRGETLKQNSKANKKKKKGQQASQTQPSSQGSDKEQQNE